MAFSFTSEDVQRIAGILGVQPQKSNDQITFHLANNGIKQAMSLTLHNNVALGEEESGSLVVAHTQHGYFELHSCVGFVVFEPDEIIFVAADATHISSMVVGKQCTCSMFVNIRREILSADFATLDPRVLMSAMQLSLTENVLP